jgi:hypothetical protein
MRGFPLAPDQLTDLPRAAIQKPDETAVSRSSIRIKND